MSSSLLFSQGVQSRTKIPSSLFQLIRLEPLLSESARRILSLPCTASDMELRHAVFSRMEEEAFRTDLEHFYSDLTALWQASNKLKDTQNECEQLLGFYTCACRFITASESAETVARALDTQHHREFRAHCEKCRLLSERLKPHVERLALPMERIRTSLLTFQRSGVWLRDDENEKGIIQTVYDLAKSLDLTVEELPEQRCLAMPHELSESLMFLYPNEFEQIRHLAQEYAPLETKIFFDVREELNFYFSVYELVLRAEGHGIPHCLPDVKTSPEFTAKNVYDVTLLTADCANIVPNDVDFQRAEPFSFLTGANGGGKTTYLRAVCTNLILASGGCPMFATEGTVSEFSYIGAHFPANESEGSGRLYAEQERADKLLDLAKNGGFLFFNETFSGANDRKGVFLTLDCASHCVENGIFGLFVTHFHEVVGHRYPILTTVVEAENDNRRTYRITKNPGTKSSYAEDVLRKYRLSADTLHLRGGDEQ